MNSRTISTGDHGDPTSRYDSPMALAADESLSIRQRIGLLESWERNARQLQGASGEGLQAEASAETNDGVYLQEIARALRELGAEVYGARAQPDVSGSPADRNVRIAPLNRS